MGMKIQKHHSEHLDGTKGRWRPTLQGSKLLGPDGHSLSHDEGVVISCPGCGAPQGVGFDDVKIVNGKTDRPWRCYHCRYEVDVMEFEKHQEPEGREHFAQLQDEAQKEIAAARIRHVHSIILQNMQAELHDRAMAEAKKVLPDGAGNHRELFRKFVDEQKAKESGK